MCCIFTCCGWIIDLVQRFWTFTMSCCISSAVCCALVTASMSGVALGYNYSLAEYIELKETNVSVYLKRGVFDDEVADEMDWRRSGGGPPARRSESDSSLPAEEYIPLPARRRDGIFDEGTTEPMPTESIFESDDHHKYEGSLFKLTGKPITDYALDALTKRAPITVGHSYTESQSESNQINDVGELINRRKMEYTRTTTKQQTTKEPVRDPLDQMRIIQQIINNRKNAAKKLTPTTTTVKTVPYYLYPKVAQYSTTTPIGREAEKHFRMMMGDHPNYDPAKWYNPRPSTPSLYNVPTMPVIQTPRPTVPILSVMSPSRRRIVAPSRTETHPDETSTKLQLNYRKSFGNQGDESSESEKEKDLLNTLNEPENKEYEDDDIKGLPVRKKRSIINPKNYTDTKNNKKDRIQSLNKSFNINIKNNTKEYIDKEKAVSMFEKLIAVIKIINTLFEFGETTIAEISRVKETTISVLTSSQIPTAHIADLSGISTSTDKFIVIKLIKSTIIS